MKIQDTNQFIAERMNINPITRAELDTAIKKTAESKFNKFDLKTGYIVKTNNGLLRMYISYNDMLNFPIFDEYFNIHNDDKKEGIIFHFNEEEYLNYIPLSNYGKQFDAPIYSAWIDFVYPVNININKFNDITVITDTYIDELITGIKPIRIKH